MRYFTYNFLNYNCFGSFERVQRNWLDEAKQKALCTLRGDEVVIDWDEGYLKIAVEVLTCKNLLEVANDILLILW